MQFAVTFDYLCPFARNAHESVLAGMAEGRDWEPLFHPFSLSQGHVKEGGADVYEDTTTPGVLALHWGIAVRDSEPGSFLRAHGAIFAARHDHGLDLLDETVIRDAVGAAGGDVRAIAEVVASGIPARTLAAEHTEAVRRWGVFGVPTFISDDVGTFVRFMERGRASDIDRVLEWLGWQGLNEFKRTRVPR